MFHCTRISAREKSAQPRGIFGTIDGTAGDGSENVLQATTCGCNSDMEQDRQSTNKR